jgi:hypothetical protein
VVRGRWRGFLRTLPKKGVSHFFDYARPYFRIASEQHPFDAQDAIAKLSEFATI